jgi:hypothetical protein
MDLCWMTIRLRILIRDRSGSRMVCTVLRGSMINGHSLGAMIGGKGLCLRRV